MPQLRRKDLFIDNILGVYPIIFRGAIILPLLFLLINGWDGEDLHV